MKTRKITTILVGLVLAVGVSGLAGTAAAQIQPKIDTDVLKTKKLDNVSNPALPQKMNANKVNRSMNGLDTLSDRLDRALRDFKTQHGKTRTVARELVTQSNQCYDRIYTRGQITAAERQAFCRAGSNEVSCKMAVFEQCRSRYISDYELALAELEVKRSRLQCLLYDYGQGASADAQADLMGLHRVRHASELPGMPSVPNLDFSHLARLSGCR